MGVTNFMAEGLIRQLLITQIKLVCMVHQGSLLEAKEHHFGCILSHLSSVHVSTTHFSMIYFNIFSHMTICNLIFCVMTEAGIKNKARFHATNKLMSRARIFMT
jgi:hypothetical protein